MHLHMGQNPVAPDIKSGGRAAALAQVARVTVGSAITAAGPRQVLPPPRSVGSVQSTSGAKSATTAGMSPRLIAA
jgi:hypothetical protein